MPEHEIRLRVRVRDADDNALVHAKVQLFRTNALNPTGAFTYDTRFAAFTISHVDTGEYLLKMAAENFEGQEPCWSRSASLVARFLRPAKHGSGAMRPGAHDSHIDALGGASK